MRHTVAGFLPACFAGAGRLEADPLHDVRPLAVMVSPPARRSEMMLVEVDHLMHQGGENRDRQAVFKVGRVQRDFIAADAVIPLEPASAEIAVTVLVALQRNHTVRQLVLEQLRIEKLVCDLEVPVKLLDRLQ